MADSSAASDSPLILGKVSGVFGVKGWLKLFSHTEPREAILDYRDCLVKRRSEWQTVRWAEGKRHGKLVIARPEGVAAREEAEAWVGAEIGILREKLPPAGDESWYWSDLEGLAVVNKGGNALGVVDHLLATGAHDVLVVKGDSEILIPFVVGGTVLSVDLDAGVIKVDWEWD